MVFVFFKSTQYNYGWIHISNFLFHKLTSVVLYHTVNTHTQSNIDLGHFKPMFNMWTNLLLGSLTAPHSQYVFLTTAE